MIAKVKTLAHAPQLKSIAVSNGQVLGVSMTDEILVVAYLSEPPTEHLVNTYIPRPRKTRATRKEKIGMGAHPLADANGEELTT